MSNISELPWIEKYRPASLDEVIDHDAKIATLKSLVDSNELTHLLLTGPAGTGKTSIIITLAKYIYGKDEYRNYITDINGSSERGIDTIRNQVTQFIVSKSDKVKLVILDEADALTLEAQGALKSVIEKYSRLARFCLICNDANKILPALHSRCTKLIFTHLNRDAMKKRVIDIVKQEKMRITEKAIDCLLDFEKDFRQILNILQGMKTYYMSQGTTIKSDEIYEYLGKPTQATVDKTIDMLFGSSFEETVDHIKDMVLSGSIKLPDLLYALNDKVISLGLDINKKAFLFTALSDIEKKLRLGCREQMLITLLVSAFLKVRHELKESE